MDGISLASLVRTELQKTRKGAIYKQKKIIANKVCHYNFRFGRC